MKTILLFSISAVLASCSVPAEWAGTPNPLDTPEADRTKWHSGAYGHFGPFGNGEAFDPR